MRTIVLSVRTLVLIAIFLLTSLISFSQSLTSGNGKYEIGLGVGPLFFLGDLGGNKGIGTKFVKDVNLPLTHMAKGIYANIYATEWLGFRFGLNHGKLEGYDSLIRDKGGAENFRRVRNLQFQSPLLEGYIAVELYPIQFLFEQYDDALAKKIQPYGLLGIGMCKFNPQGRYYDPAGNSYWVDLHPLHLEGQGMLEYPNRKPYKLNAVEALMGFGVKYYLNDNMYIGTEILHRNAFSDYLDDVSTTYIDANLFDNYLSPIDAERARQLYYRRDFNNGSTQTRPLLDEQRGNPKNNDSFFSSVIRIGWRLNDPNSYRARASRQVYCPKL